MLCSRVLGQLNAYCDYELTGAEMLPIQEHLSGCADCAREYASVRQLKQLLRGLPPKEADRPFTPEVLKKSPRLKFDLPDWWYAFGEWLRTANFAFQRSACHLATGAALAFSVLAISALQTPQRPDAAHAHVPETLAPEGSPADGQPYLEPAPFSPVLQQEAPAALYPVVDPGHYTGYGQVSLVGYTPAASFRRVRPVWPGVEGEGLSLELNGR